MRNKFISYFFFLCFITNASLASTTKKIIQVKMPSAINKIYFSYRDGGFNEKILLFSNASLKDTIISVSVELLPGQVLSHSELIDIGGKFSLIHQSFIVPVNDTIQFEMGIDRKLALKTGIKFLLEDVINVYFENPAAPNKEFLDKSTGLSLSKLIFKNNKISIEKNYNDHIITKNEQTTLLNIAKADYYFRLIFWSLRNNKLSEISEEIVSLQNDKDSIQMVKSPSTTQLFGNYVQYVINRDELDQKDTRNIVRSIIKLGWQKNISFAYINYVLSDIKGDPKVLTACYVDLKEYLDGDFPVEFEKLRKKMLPVITNLNKVILVDGDSKQSTLKQLLDKYPKSYFLIDFWASWCVPCREEAPLFEAAKKDYSHKNIVFVSLSTDEDNNLSAWKKALKDDGLLKSTNHYKLVAPKTNVLFNNFSVPSIPRYILINAKGEFIDPEFPRPSDPEFKKALSKIF